MKTKADCNSVKVTKVVKEVNDILNSDNSRQKKLILLQNIPLKSRKGTKEAQDMIYNYKHKFDDYIKGAFNTNVKKHLTKVLGDADWGYFTTDNPRGLTVKTQKTWRDRLNYYLYKKYNIGITLGGFDGIEITKENNSLIIERAKEIHQFMKDSSLSQLKYNKEVPFEVLQSSRRGWIYFKGYYISAHEIINEDWGFYGKSWHKKYGPKRTIEKRYVSLTKKGVTKEIDINRWGRNWLLHLLVEEFNISVKRTSKKALQLNKNVTLKRIKKIGNYKIYSRALKSGKFSLIIGYVIYDTKLHDNYHSLNMNELVEGLRNKRKKKYNTENEIINYTLAKSLYFCDEGIGAFCDDNNINITDSFTRKELRNIVLKNRALNCKYYAELKILGITLNCRKI